MEVKDGTGLNIQARHILVRLDVESCSDHGVLMVCDRAYTVGLRVKIISI